MSTVDQTESLRIFIFLTCVGASPLLPFPYLFSYFFPLCSLSFPFSLDVSEVFQGHTNIFPFVYILVTGFTQWDLFSIDTCHHLVEGVKFYIYGF